MAWCWRERSGWLAAGVVVSAEEAGQCCDGFLEEGVESGLLVGGVLGAEGGDVLVPPGGGVVLVLGGLPADLVAGPPPVQCLVAGHGRGGGPGCVGGGVSRG